MPRRSVMVKSSKQLRPVLWVGMLTWVGDRLSNASVLKYDVETELLVLFLKLNPSQVYQRKLLAKIPNQNGTRTCTSVVSSFNSTHNILQGASTRQLPSQSSSLPCFSHCLFLWQIGFFKGENLLKIDWKRGPSNRERSALLTFSA